MRFFAILLTGFSLTVCSAAFSQVVSSPDSSKQTNQAVQFGFKGGLSLSKMAYYKNENSSEKGFGEFHPGTHLAGMVIIPFNSVFSMETDLAVTSRGYNYSLEGESFEGPYSTDGKVILYYADLPVTFRAAYKVKNTKIYAGIGGYFGVGLNALVKYKGTFAGVSSSGSTPLEIGNDRENDIFKRFDYGATFTAGAEFRKFQAGILFDFGLNNVSYSEDLRNRLVQLSFGYFLPHRK